MAGALPGSPKTSAIRAHRGGSALPWTARSCAGGKIRPRVANNSAWAWVQQDSVSASVPSQSKATAFGIPPSNGQGLMVWGTVLLSGRRYGRGAQGGRERDVAAR